jgi:hypothetical protein
VEIAAESREAGCSHRGLGDRRRRALLEVAQQPAGRDARVPARLLPPDQQRSLDTEGRLMAVLADDHYREAGRFVSLSP